MRAWLGATAGGLPRQFWYLWAGTLVNKAGSFVILFLSIYLTTVRGFAPGFAGLVLGSYGLGGALGAVAGGVLADRWGRRASLLTAQYGAAALMPLLGAVRAPAAIVAVTLALGVFAEAARPATSAMLADLVPPADRMRAFTLQFWAINLGFAVAAGGAGLAAGVDFGLLFAIDAATTAAMATVIAVGVRETRPAGGGPQRQVSLAAVARDRVFGVYLLGSFLLAVVVMQHTSTLPIAMSHDGHPPATFGLIVALNGVLIICGQLFVPRLVSRAAHGTVLAVAGLLLGLGFGLGALADSATFWAVTVLVWTLGEMINVPAASALIAELAGEHARGRYMGLASLSWQLACIVAPIGGGLLQQHAGDAALWLACAGLGVVIAGLHLAAGPAYRRRLGPHRPATTGAAPPAGQAEGTAGQATPAAGHPPPAVDQARPAAGPATPPTVALPAQPVTDAAAQPATP